jgi:hypothetical protein
VLFRSLTFTGGSGLSCLSGGLPDSVAGASGSLTRSTTDNAPL